MARTEAEVRGTEAAIEDLRTGVIPIWAPKQEVYPAALTAARQCGETDEWALAYAAKWWNRDLDFVKASNFFNQIA